MTGILHQVEGSLKDFRPRNQREFVALQIAQRLDDRGRLARYLNVSREHPKRELLEAARLATQRAASSHQRPADLFFELLDQFRKEAA